MRGIGRPITERIGRYAITMMLLFPGSPIILAQVGSSAPVTLHAEEESLGVVMEEVEAQTGLRFSYNSRLIDAGDTLTIHLERVSLDSALFRLFEGRQVTFRVVEKQIVLNRARKAEPGLGATVQVALEEEPFRITISGYVKDAATGEILIGATISVRGGAEGTISNNYGFYSLTLRHREGSLLCSYVGYQLIEIPLKIDGDESHTVHFVMQKKPSALREVKIYSDEQLPLVRTARSSEERIRPESVRKMPALFGEKDVIKSLAAIPGVKFFGDGSTIFYVRGGARDQNMITMDEAPIYNPTHLLGFFSTVVPDAIKEVTVYKGDFPANYGGRLSSHIDIRTKDGNMNRFGVDGSVGLLSSRLSVEGPIRKDRISFFASGRRSYITRPLQLLNDRISDLHFYDLHLKLNYRINAKSRLFFSLYRGADNFEQEASRDVSSGIRWNNSTTTLRWNHLFSDRLFSNLTLLGSKYDYYLNTHIENNDYWYSHIGNLTLKYDFTWYIHPRNTFRFGLLTAGHFHDPGNIYRGGVEFDPGLDLSTKRTREIAFYGSEQFILGPKVSFRAGIRFTIWSNVGPATEYSIVPATGGNFERDSLAVKSHADGRVYHSIATADPRLSLIYQPAHHHILKFSYSRTSQFQFLITNSISPFTSMEVWLPSGPNVPPQSAHQFTLGYSHHFGQGGVRLDLEGYYKRTNHLIDYRDHARMLMNPLVEYELLFGTGEGYGIETILQRSAGRFSGWISYTWSRSLSTVAEVNQGKPYPAYSDRPHDFSLYLTWALGRRINLTANFIYMTGAPFTTPTGFYFYDHHQVPVYSLRNNDRLPDYHRLDLALNWQLNRPEHRFRHELIFSVYNLYNRKNPVALHFNKTEEEGGNYVVPADFYQPQQLESTMYYIYGLIPSVSYHFSF